MSAHSSLSASSIYGGYGGHAVTAPDAQHCATLVHQLEAAAQGLRLCASPWHDATIQTGALRAQVPLCPALCGQTVSYASTTISTVHTRLQPWLLIPLVSDLGIALQQLSNDIGELAALIARAHSLYSQAEQTTWRLLTGLVTGSAVGFFANGLSACTGMISALAQGNQLRVLPVSGTALPAVTSIEGTLSNLQLLSSRSDYATIAIQQYVDQRGKRSWMVTIPGTDAHADSPIGWLQNVELMSDMSSTRLQADSVRFVLDAMKQAGIAPSEQVTLVGHSQGGIVAATIAADMAEHYQISHVITAGSPIANHPIPSSTWVTSIEVEADVVPDLDGRHNPSRPTWLTVRAREAKNQSASGSDEERESAQNSAKATKPAQSKASSQASKSESHSMNKQQEAWRDALYLGSPAVELHDAHIRELTAGTLESTQYYQGRLDSNEMGTQPSPEAVD
ncbi:alpha/beta hydrolase [Bifidobacterium aquikefiricola]|uniref:DUF2974 domain-containing protein n=1 Tax=Bifidobacterium aquikefiricola TaxID=3059038 RepID=A0AB39U4Z1_9BIFI